MKERLVKAAFAGLMGLGLGIGLAQPAGMAQGSNGCNANGCKAGAESKPGDAQDGEKAKAKEKKAGDSLEDAKKAHPELWTFFTVVDGNKNGLITLKENGDQNADGKLVLDELKKFYKRIGANKEIKKTSLVAGLTDAGAEAFLKRADKNADSHLDMVELGDTSKDGNLDFLEMVAFVYPPQEQGKNQGIDVQAMLKQVLKTVFDAIDADRDGSITLKEHGDANADGKVVLAELAAFYTGLSKNPAVNAGGLVKTPKEADLKKSIDKLDTDKNSGLSLAELGDTDKDGKLSFDEYLAANPVGG